MTAQTPVRVLVTGAAGFIGSHVVDACLSRGWHVTAIDAFTDYYPEAIKARNVRGFVEDPRVAFVRADLLDTELTPLLDGVRYVFHLAAQPGIRGSWGSGFRDCSRQNLEASQRLLEASAGLPALARFVFTSSSSIYGDAETLPTSEDLTPLPVSPYGMTKLAGEHLAGVYMRNHGLPVVCTRLFTVYGPRQRPDMAFARLIDAALHDREFSLFGDGRQTRDFTFVDDAVAGTVAAAQFGSPGRRYNIGSGSRVSMWEAIGYLGAHLGRPIRIRQEDAQRGDARDTAADIARARSELRYQPATPVRDGILRQLHWQKQQMSAARAGRFKPTGHMLQPCTSPPSRPPSSASSAA